MIKYNNSNINDWNFGDSNIIKVYKHGAVVFYRFDSESQEFKVCYAVVDDISQYQETEFEDVYDKTTEKWYKLNNLNRYEEYGVYGSGRTSCEGSSRLPQGYTEVEYIENTSTPYIDTGIYLNTSNFEVGYTIVGNSSFWGYCHQNAANGTWLGVENAIAWYGRWSSNTTYRVDMSSYLTSGTNAIVYKQNGVTINGNTVSKSLTMGSDSIANKPLLFFVRYDFYIGDVERKVSFKAKSLYIKNNGELVRNFVPAKRNSDNKYGFYDLVTNTFYLSPNNVDFSGGSPVTPTDCVTTYEGKLTIDGGYEYQYSGGSWVNVGEVSGSSITIKSPEYVGNKSSSNGVINLGVVLKDNTKFQIKFNPTKAGGGAIFGETNAPSDNDDYRVFWYGTQLYYDYGNNRLNANKAINTVYEYEIGNYYIKDLVTSSYVSSGATKSGTATSHTRNIVLFYTTVDISNVYYMKVYEGDTLIRDFIPWTDMNGNYGMFDKVSMEVFSPAESLSGSSNVTDVTIGEEVYPQYYEEKSEPLDNLTFNTLAEAQAYAKANCVYDGMKAVIASDRYYFDSSDENGWVKILEYYKFEDVTPGGGSGWTISGSSTYNPDSSYYDDFDLQTTSTSSSYKIAKVTIYGYDHFTYYLRSYHPYTFSYGYVMATNVDEVSTPPSTMQYYSSSAITHTFYFNKSPKSAVNLSNYRRITYNNLDKTVEHTFYVYFYGRTYSSYGGNATILIPKEQTNENWEQVTFSASSNVASSSKNLYIDGNNSTSGGTQYWYYRWMVGLPSGSHSSYTNYSSYDYCPNVTSSTFTSVAGNSRQVNFTYDNTTNKNLSMRLVDSNGNVLSPSDTVYYYIYRYNSCNASSITSTSLPSSQTLKVGGSFHFSNSSNRHYIYGYTAPATGVTYYVDNYSTTFDLVYTALTREAVTITYTTYDPSDTEVPSFKTDITWPYGGGTTSSTTLASYTVPYTYPYSVSQTSNKFSALTYTYTAGQASRTINFTLYPNNREFATVAAMEAYQYVWEGMNATVGTTKYEYKNGQWVEKGGSLPDVPFTINYNAKQYNSSTKTLLKTDGQLANVNAVITAGTPTVHDGYITIASGTRAVISGYQNYFNRTNSAPTITIVSKQRTDGQNGHMFANRDSSYNWMYRCYATQLSFHGSSSIGGTSVTTQPVIESVRVNSSRLLTFNNWTNGTSSTSSNFSYGNTNSTATALFQGYATTTGEYFVGDFYWVYMCQGTLTDEQVQQVIDYNENL